MLQYTFLLCLVYSANIVSAEDQVDSICDSDFKKKKFDEFITGGIEDVPSSDPLYVNSIVGDLPTFKFIVFNATFSGLKNCNLENLKDSSSEVSHTLSYTLVCKHLVLKGHYLLNGEFMSHHVEGTGEFRNDYYDFDWILTIQYQQIIDENNKQHNRVQNYKFDFEPRGKLVFDYKNMYCGDSEKSAVAHKLANENWKIIESEVRATLMGKITSLYIDNVDKYLKTVLPERGYHC